MDASHPPALPPLGRMRPAHYSPAHRAGSFTFAPFRVRVPYALCTHKNIPTPDGIGIFLVRHEGLEPPTFANGHAKIL